MGNGASKEEQLYQAVQNGNQNAVKALRRDGAALEFHDKEGRTPLILACTRGDLFEMALTLLNLGANMKAYRPGAHGGFPLHHAAKRGLDKTVLLLLSRGADSLAVNDDALTPLDMARNRGHVSVVRMIEDRISLFTGVMRELSGPGFLEALVPHWVTKKIWVVVLPTGSDPKRAPKFELVIYQSPKVPVPRTIIALTRVEVEEPKFSSPDPVLVVTDKSTKTKYKFLSGNEGDKVQLKRLYEACKGIRQTSAASVPGMPSQAALQGLSALIRPTNQQHPPASRQDSQGASTPSYGPSPEKLINPTEIPDDVALKMAIDASLRTASEEGIALGGHEDGVRHDGKLKIGSAGWGDDEKLSNHSGWSSSSEVGLNRDLESSEVPSKRPEPVLEATAHDPTQLQEPGAGPSTPSAHPSAPPLPAEYVASGSTYDGPIQYPAIDTSPVKLDFSEVTAEALQKNILNHEGPAASPSAPKAEEKGSQCVVCWDAPAQGVCIPCGHLAGCMDCLAEIKSKDWGCPVCRAPIQQVIKVYAV